MFRQSILFFIILILFFAFACSDEEPNGSLEDNSFKDISTDISMIEDTTNDVFTLDTNYADIKDTAFIDTEYPDIIADNTLVDNIEFDTYEDIMADTITDIISDVGDEIIADTGTDTITDYGFEDTMDSGLSDVGVLQPIINEMMIQPNFSDTELGQYIEIYNPNDFGIDINGYKLKTDTLEFTISNAECDTVMMAKSYLVIGATKDPLKNSYAKVKCEWADKFSLTGATYIELLRSDNISIEKVNLSNLQIKKGSSLEIQQDQFKPAPSLITFLDETGLYNGDRGSPAKPNYNLIIRDKLLDSETIKDRIEYENSLHRYSALLSKGDIIAFYADVDRMNGDLKLFASLLNSNEEFISPDIYISDITYDFFIYQLIRDSDTYFFQVQPDFFYKFVPANIEVTYFRADGIKIKKDFIELKIGEQYQIESFATFSQNKDLKDFPIEKTLLSYSSNDPNIAEVSSSGLITGKNIGSTTLYISYYYVDNTSLDTSMVVNVYNQPSNETCDTAIDATNGINTYGSTIGANNDYDPEKCIFSLFSGGDIVYYVDAEPNATYEVIVTPYASFDPMIYVTDDCSKSECLYGTVLNGAGEPEKLTFKNETFSKKRFYIIIDGEAGDEGSFQLEIKLK